jgi:excisionase family DNA binding protein
MEDMQLPQLYDIRESAGRLSISPWTVRLWIRTGRISAVRIGRRVLVESSEISRLIDSCRTHAARPSSVVHEGATDESNA